LVPYTRIFKFLVHIQIQVFLLKNIEIEILK
jgi:hypothetical protein